MGKFIDETPIRHAPRRKHPQTLTVTIHFDDEQWELFERFVEARSDAWTVRARRTGDPHAEATIEYGPVRGANVDDVKRRLDEGHIRYVIVGKTHTERECVCASDVFSCAAP